MYSQEITALRFVIRINSLESTSLAAERVGILDPAGGTQGMCWNCSANYTFVKEKIESASPQAPVNLGADDRIFQYYFDLCGDRFVATINYIKTTTVFESARWRNSQSSAKGRSAPSCVGGYSGDICSSEQRRLRYQPQCTCISHS
ncbi:MAG: hypothetical protein NZM43_05340 [Saprospiraceae bacterium]|nr:hypothetical protein [Saprospiraceae bacterium]MDW8483732.1 hypothetical protein [Saprospiraceae bacterium]